MSSTLQPLIEPEEEIVIEHGTDEPVDAKEKPKKTNWIIFGAIISIIAAGLIGTGLYFLLAKPSTRTTVGTSGLNALPGCDIYPSFSCNGNSGDMDAKWSGNEWRTPSRGSSDWEEGFQDMSVLTGYAQLVYSSDHRSCTVNVVTRTKDSMSLSYSFDGETQSSASKTFSTSFTKPLKIIVTSSSGARLELDDVDFMWNAGSIKARNGDYRNGQKGAIIEMFGWPDEDIAKECEFIGNAGYLGVKLFPHQEQVMSSQVMEGVLNPWYFMYQPVSYRLEGRAGNRSVLREMIKTCRSHGVRVYADAVVNHMSGNGNDRNNHRNPGQGCSTWPGKQSSAAKGSPYYTPAWTYEEGTNVLEYPAVPYGPMDFHCDKALNSWNDGNLLNTGWLSGLTDLDTSKDYVRQRIADYFIDLLSIGFSGFRIDAAKHIQPSDLAAIFAKFKAGLGGNIPEDWVTWLEVLVGGEASLLVQGDGDYSYTGGLTRFLQGAGLSSTDIDKIKIWWSVYPNEPGIDYGSLSMHRKVIQNDDHDQQNPGSSSRDMHDKGCVLIKNCDPNSHRNFEKILFNGPYECGNNNDDYPIRLILSSFYYGSDGALIIPDGLSDCANCKLSCESCRSRSKVAAHNPSAAAYSGSDYTRVHRDGEIIAAMKNWMHI